MKLQATAIICAYNEENTISNILNDVYELHLFSEIIVVNDGSKDKTSQRIKAFKKSVEIKDIHLMTNKGKGFAMAKGAEMASNKFLVFIDADLSDFSRTHALKLLTPVLNRKADMVLGQATNTFIPSHINPFKSLSGQRALRKADILPILKEMETARYGVETLINMHFKANNKIVEYVYLKNLVHPCKFQKTKPHKAIFEFIMEGCQIVATTFSNYSRTVKPNKNRILNTLGINN